MDSVTVAKRLALSCSAYAAMNLVSRLTIPKELNSDQKHQWRQKMNSLAHALVISIIAPVVLFAETDFTSKTGYFFDPIRYSSETGSSALIISMGYFVFDSVDIVINTLHHRDTSERLLHHIFTSVGLLRILVTGEVICISLLVLAAEFNTIFLRIRKLMLLKGIRQGSYFKGVVRLNFATFAIFKVGLIALTTVYGTYCAYGELLLADGRLADFLVTFSLTATVTFLNWNNFKLLVRCDLPTVYLSSEELQFLNEAVACIFKLVKSSVKTSLLLLKVIILPLKQ